MINKNKIKNDLVKLGIEKGDNIFLTIDLAKVGYFYKSRLLTLESWRDIFTELIGPTGSLSLAAYTSGFFRFSSSKKTLFDRFTPTYAGSFPNYLIKDKTSIRSNHPTNSLVGFGVNLKSIFQNHDHNSLSYSVMGKLADLPQSKHLMIGTVDKKNAPQSMHYAQELLGYTKKHPFKGLFQINHIVNGKKRIFSRNDIGGCSSGGYKIFGSLMLKQMVKTGYVGNAYSTIMPAKESIECAKNALLQNKRLVMCDNKSCADCYGSWNYNRTGILSFYFRLILNFKNKILPIIFGKN